MLKNECCHGGVVENLDKWDVSRGSWHQKMRCCRGGLSQKMLKKGDIARMALHAGGVVDSRHCRGRYCWEKMDGNGCRGGSSGILTRRERTCQKMPGTELDGRPYF